MTDALRIANGRFARGFNCAQSIFSAFAGKYGISSEFAVRLSAPFGAGMGTRGRSLRGVDRRTDDPGAAIWAGAARRQRGHLPHRT